MIRSHPQDYQLLEKKRLLGVYAFEGIRVYAFEGSWGIEIFNVAKFGYILSNVLVENQNE